MDGSRLVKQVYEGDRAGRRARGQPKKRWSDHLDSGVPSPLQNTLFHTDNVTLPSLMCCNVHLAATSCIGDKAWLNSNNYVIAYASAVMCTVYIRQCRQEMHERD